MALARHFTLDAKIRRAYSAPPKRKRDVSLRKPQPAMQRFVERLFGNDYACARGGMI